MTTTAQTQNTALTMEQRKALVLISSLLSDINTALFNTDLVSIVGETGDLIDELNETLGETQSQFETLANEGLTEAETQSLTEFNDYETKILEATNLISLRSIYTLLNK